jgi:hypothetical protein
MTIVPDGRKSFAGHDRWPRYAVLVLAEEAVRRSSETDRLSTIVPFFGSNDAVAGICTDIIEAAAPILIRTEVNAGADGMGLPDLLLG